MSSNYRILVGACLVTALLLVATASYGQGPGCCDGAGGGTTELADDLTPALGGNLDTAGFTISDSVGNVTVADYLSFSTGLYIGATRLCIVAGGTCQWDQEMRSSGGYWRLLNSAATATAGNICPNDVDTNTCIGWAGADQLSLVSGGVESMRLQTAASGVNYIDVTPAATGARPTIAAAGSDANIDLLLQGKGTGDVTATGNLNENIGVGSSSLAGNYATAFGNNASANAGTSTALSAWATADATGSTALGYYARVGPSNIGGIAIGSSVIINEANSAIIGSSTDVTNWYFGGPSNVETTPSSITFQPSGGSGTNIAAGDFTIAGGRATGNAAGGDIIFSTSDAGGSGTTLQTLSEKARITVSGVLSLTPLASAPATCSIGDFYVDTSGAACACSATNTWSNMHATGTCV